MILKTRCGDIEGIELENSLSFLGIKYGNANRFCKPVEVKVWEGVYNAKEYGAACPQHRSYYNENVDSNFYNKEFRRNLVEKYSEHCQFLNIFAPKNASKVPVIIYLHGGSFTTCSSGEGVYDGTKYAEKGVILVTLNYRLNIFGYYAEKERGCNFGLYDQLCAIDWIYNNIADYGGDKENITLMGQSAGAMSVQDIISIDNIEKKIKRAIMISGGGVRKLLLPQSKPNYKYWNKIKKNLGDIDKASEEELFKAWNKTSIISKMLLTKPVIDENLVKDNLNKAKIPCIMGMVEKDMFPPVLKNMIKSYAKKLTSSGIDCWLYKFEHNLPECDKGTFHSSDLWYVFNNLDKSWRKFAEYDQNLASEIMERVVAFAKNGDPNNEAYKDWLPCPSRVVKIFK